MKTSVNLYKAFKPGLSCVGDTRVCLCPPWVEEALGSLLSLRETLVEATRWGLKRWDFACTFSQKPEERSFLWSGSRGKVAPEYRLSLEYLYGLCTSSNIETITNASRPTQQLMWFSTKEICHYEFVFRAIQ